MNEDYDARLAIGGATISTLIILSTLLSGGSTTGEIAPPIYKPIPAELYQPPPYLPQYKPGSYVSPPPSRREVEQAVEDWVDRKKFERNPVRFAIEKMWEY